MKLLLRSWSALAFAGFFGLLTCASYASGLSTAFTDVVVRDVPTGEPFFVAGPSGRGLVVQNLGERPLKVKFQALAPLKNQLRGDAKPIPDVTWVRFDPPELIIPARAEGICRISLHIPSNATRFSEFFQVMIWSRGEAQETMGLKMAAGLLSRLRFSQRPPPPEASRQPGNLLKRAYK